MNKFPKQRNCIPVTIQCDMLFPFFNFNCFSHFLHSLFQNSFTPFIYLHFGISYVFLVQILRIMTSIFSHLKCLFSFAADNFDFFLQWSSYLFFLTLLHFILAIFIAMLVSGLGVSQTVFLGELILVAVKFVYDFSFLF